ncbi:MAG: hypothetical protein N2689_07305 [Verrucomicrobiae bacterium]|nr:hypothetical protein [Verrucomicrobiae bacterium]
MNDKTECYRRSALRAVQFQLNGQQPDGSFAWEGYPRNAYHKQACSWTMAGHIEPAHRLLTWVKMHTLSPDGQLQDYDGDVRKHCWLFRGAHQLDRFDVSWPVMSFLLSCQLPLGGFPRRASENRIVSSATAQMGLSALHFGRQDVAEAAAACVLRILESQPDDSRFYFQMTAEGKLVTRETDAKAPCLDAAVARQNYSEIGLPLQLMCRLYQATANKQYLEFAAVFFELTVRRFPDAFGCIGADTCALGAALYYLLAGDRRAQQAACRFADFLVATQHPQGGWRDPGEPDIPLSYVDHAAESSVFLFELAALLPSAEIVWLTKHPAI